MRPPSFPSVASPSRLRAFHAKAYNTRPQRRRPDFIEELPNSALIRLHGHRLLDSPAEALALIRTVERKYGAIREYRFLKDFEVQSYYQVFVNVAFQDPKALARLPAKGETVNFTLPTTISNRPGGVGLDELEPFLAAQEFADSKVPSFDNVMGNVMENKKEEVIKFTIEATESNWHTPPRAMPALKPDTDVARSFIAWGGFHEMKPIPAETPLPTSQLFRSDGIDQARMRRALRDYSAMLHESSPFETFKDFDSSKESTLTPVLDWEPLPGHESTTTDTPMPSAIHAEVAQKELHTLEAILTPKPTIAPAATSETSSTTITVEVAQETPGPATPLPVAPKMPASVVEAEAIAARITQSPIRPPKQKQKQKQKNKKPQAPTTARPTQQPPPQKSLREIRNEALQARQSEFAKREQAKAEEPQTVKSKLSSFFGSIF